MSINGSRHEPSPINDKKLDLSKARNREMKSFPRWLIVVTGLVMLTLIGGGYWFYIHQEQTFRENSEANLQAAAELKVNQIAEWRSEQLRDASVIMKSTFLSGALERFLADPQTELAEKILSQFRSIQELFNYRDVMLVDRDGQVHLSLRKHHGSLHEEAARSLVEALRDERPVMTDLHAGPADLPPHIDVVAPLFSETGKTKDPDGAVIFQIDARQFLYPLIQFWPTPSVSAETLLVRQEGDAVLFLNNLRHQPDTALKLRIPLSRKDVPAVMAVLGKEGIVPGKDYRGVDVLSVLKPVPNSPWFMVAKVDESEALAGWRFRSILILVLVIALLAFLFTAIGVVWQKTGKAHYQELFLAETALRKVVKELSCLYGISKLMERQGISLEEILQGVVDIIPGSWQYPETTHARVILEGREFKTENFADAVWKQSADIVAYGDRIGSLEVGYAEERPESDEGPFLKEERYLLNAIVERLVHVIEHKRAEEALQASEEHHRILIEHIPQRIFLKDHNSVYLSCNANYASTLGIAPEQIVGKDDFAFHPPELAQVYRADDQECMATGMLKDIEEPYQVAGQDRWVHTIKVPYRDREGQVIGVLGIFEDITERKQVEEALRESEERFRLSAKSLSDVIYEWDLGNSVKWFGNIDGLLGYAPGGFPHTLEAWIDILHPEDRDRVWKEVEKQLRDDTTYDIEYRVQHKEGGWRDWAARGAAVKDASGKPLRWIGAVTDITDRKRNEELALQSARLKSVADLSSGVAHHFNNLLQIVIGNTSLSLADLESGDLSEIKTNLERMLGAATRGAEMVKRLQTFANMGADVTERESEVFDAATTAGNAAEVFKPVWISDPEKKGIKIDLKLDLEDRCLVKGQETEIFEVIVNLIRNAAEALPKGGDIEVKTYREANEVVVTIRDTGTGIAEEDLSRVFQPFWSSKGVGIGKGMGLAVTHGLVKRHGGTISVDSKVGVGTTFTIRLPLAHEPVTKTEQSSMSISGDRLTILVIDDDLSIATLLERICAKAGHTVFRALSGQEGLAIFNKETVDLVISDLGMPGMNGWDVGKAIQSICQERGVSKPPFILLTAWGGQELEKEKIAESGTDAVVAKPIDRATVLATVQEITARFTIGSRVP